VHPLSTLSPPSIPILGLRLDSPSPHFRCTSRTRQLDVPPSEEDRLQSIPFVRVSAISNDHCRQTAVSAPIASPLARLPCHSTHLLPLFRCDHNSPAMSPALYGTPPLSSSPSPPVTAQQPSQSTRSQPSPHNARQFDEARHYLKYPQK
jgi:hypothetical protein